MALLTRWVVVAVPVLAAVPVPAQAAMLALPAPAAAAVAAAGGVRAAPPASTPAPQPQPSQQQPPPSAAAADHRQENKTVVRRYLTEVLAAGKLDKLDEIVASSFVDRSPSAAANLRGLAAARQAQKRLRELFTKVEYSPQALIAEGDQVAARYVLLATLKPERGAPAAPPLLLNGIALFRVRAGRIQEVFVLNDQLGLLRQLGYTLVPPGGSAAAPGPPATTPPAPGPPPGSPPPAGSPGSPPPAISPGSPLQASPPPNKRAASPSGAVSPGQEP
ncbi:MAG TPA: ester cyclase [Thermoanaerobaculia bacterium]|jgi:predicted ester cyclase|nr:ester cyclase [Thermoanaerobaculia bacterium]